MERLGIGFYYLKKLAFVICAIILIVAKPIRAQNNNLIERRASVYVEEPEPKPSLNLTIQNYNFYSPGNRIVGGKDVAGAGIYPFFVNWQWTCGASLIARDVLLTAAHCDVLKNNEVVINAFHAENKTTENAIVRNIIKRKKHAGYIPSTLKNDFMLLKLDKLVDNPLVVPIKVNFDSNIPADGESLRVIGMGKTSEDGKLSEILQEVDISMFTEEACKKVFGNSLHSDIMFCAGREEGGKDACQGDSGGPIFRMTSTGKVEKQVGVVSWGAGCARTGYPGVYADISGVDDWFKKELCELSDDTNVFYECPPKGDEIQVKVEVSLDKYAAEVSWEILDLSTGKAIAWEYADTFHKPFETYTRVVNLKENGTYNFRIVDFAGDGLCCKYGNGKYVVRQGSWTLARGGEFKSSEDKRFTLYRDGPRTPRPTAQPSASPSVSPSASPSVSPSASPSVSPSASPSISSSASPSVSPSNLPSVSPSASPSNKPSLRVTNVIDTSQTEKSSRDDPSPVSIKDEELPETEPVDAGNSSSIVTEEEEVSIKTGNDTMPVEGNSTTNDEIFPADKNESVPSPAATVGDDCQDTNTQIEVDREIGMKPCSWFSANFNRFDYLCKFLDVALACPHTCGTCYIVPTETDN